MNDDDRTSDHLRDGSSGEADVSAHDGWPRAPSSLECFGIAGEMVKGVAAHTEADPVATLVQLLVMFGNAIGRSAFWKVDADTHHGNLYAAIVGSTSSGAKGQSKGIARYFMEMADPGCVKLWEAGASLSSGEGLVWAVRDPVTKEQPVRKNGLVVDYEVIQTDPGIADKRLLVVESEFASALRVMQRQGNTLSPVLRQAWESGNLGHMTKTCDTRATGAHVSIIAHITPYELETLLNRVDMANGFANRFLFVLCRRMRSLPEGGGLRGVDPDLGRLFAEAVADAKTRGEIKFDDQARLAWHAVYNDLRRGFPGILGALVARGAPIVRRVAMLLALLGRREQIALDDLLGALRLWDYSEQSVAYLFKSTLGHPLAERILSALRSSEYGLTRGEIRDVLQRHGSSSEISEALDTLVAWRLVASQMESTGGRPAQRWVACDENRAGDGGVCGGHHDRAFMAFLESLQASP